MLPLTAAQREVWLAGQRSPDGDQAFRIGQYTEIHGPVDPVVFETALRTAGTEAETTRVRIDAGTDGPTQVVDPDPDWVMPFVDVCDRADPDAAAQELMAADMARPMDLTSGPLSRGALFKLSADRYQWYGSTHHLAMDAFSAALVASRVAQVYTRLVAEEPAGPTPFGSLTNLVQADLDYRTSPAFEDDRAYWTATLADLPAPAPVPARPDLLTPAENPSPGHRGPGPRAVRTTALRPPAHPQALREAADRAGVFRSRLVIAAAALYTHRTTGARDVLIGLVVTGRARPELMTTPAMMANVVPLRLAVHPGMPLAELLGRVDRAVAQAVAHQWYRGEDMARDLGLPGTIGSRFSLVVNLFAFGKTPTFAGLSCTVNHFSANLVADLSLVAVDRLDGTGMLLQLQANAERYGDADLAEHHERLLRLLDAMTGADPRRPAGTLDLLSEDERRRLIHEVNAATPPVTSAVAPQLFEAQVRATPDAVALEGGTVTLTYQELNARANRFAHALRARGIGPEDVVALVLPRSIELVVAILGVLKAGAAYLPIDPRYPQARITFMLEDARPALIVDDPDTVTAMAGEHPDTDPRVTIDPRRPAYVIYTSGSTGRPKGVVVTHVGIPGMATAGIERPALDTNSRVLQFSSPSFDVSVGDLFTALLSGATLVLPPADDPLAALPGPGSALTHAAIPPSALAAAETEATVSTLIVIGEEFPPSLVAQWAPGRRVINAYGPTETTVWSTMSTPLNPDTDGPPPIGLPIAGTRVYVLDAALQPVPPAVTGELYIAGAGLARGYLNRPGLTAGRFVACPFGPPGERMYRTGDLARWRTDGAGLDFRGRTDQQVKIRDFRVEPGEIETVLTTHPDVAQAVVVAHEHPTGKRLAAYLVPTPGTRVEPAEMARHLRRTLPEYMVPAAFVAMDTLPLTGNGKLDRDALPAPEDPTGQDTDARHPRSPREQLLCDLFAEILQVERVHIDDDFFDLGGHSLLAVRLTARIRETLGTTVSLSALFEAPTVAALAERCVAGHGDDPFATILPLRPHGSRTPLWCIHPGGGLGWSYGGLLKHIHPDHPVYAIQAPRLAQLQPHPTSVEEIATDYTERIRKIQPRGPYQFLGWSMGGLIAHAIATQLHEHGRHTALLAILDGFPLCGIPYDESTLPGMRGTLALLLAGDPQDLPPEPMTHEQVAQVLREHGGVHAGLDPHRVEAIAAILANDIRLAHDFTPDVLDGDLLLFNATADRTTNRPDTTTWWLPYLTGRIESHDIAARHDQMTQPGPLTRIGPLLAAHLDRIAATLPTPPTERAPHADRHPTPMEG